jgi:hypothetical protein
MSALVVQKVSLLFSVDKPLGLTAIPYFSWGTMVEVPPAHFAGMSRATFSPPMAMSSRSKNSVWAIEPVGGIL